MKSANKIAVVGLACRYPDADNPYQLWENMLAGRQAFRNMPAQRLNKNYFSADSLSPDKIYSSKTAVLKNYEFDTAAFRISNTNYRSADITHWLALETASAALKNAGLTDMLPFVKEKTGVITGNTLTGEQTRANLLRQRWPYVAATVASSLKKQNWKQLEITKLLTELEEEFKKPFPEMEEDSLAGGLSNTIAGRICNYFDFKGGGFTIDGACSSSLLAVAKACDAIANGDLCIAIAGGVDISLDPFELVGFSRAGALAKKQMLVYDKDSAGFWPGEGCGFVVFADYDFAQKNNLNILAAVCGWGISSDGSGGLTRPEVSGQMLALERAYSKAGYSINTVSYIEGHGTGTRAGDAVELSAVTESLKQANATGPVYISSIKANIGHTKAAAGIAGFIKSVLIMNNRAIPAAAANRNPNQLFEQQEYLKLPDRLIPYDKKIPFRIGVSSMGFGGINTHITLEEGNTVPYTDAVTNANLSSSWQDAELFLLAEPDLQSLKSKLLLLKNKAAEISFAEMTDVACTLYEGLQNGNCRTAIVAATPAELDKKVMMLLEKLTEKNSMINCDEGLFYSCSKKELRAGLLCPGQGNNALKAESLLTRRFSFFKKLIPDFLNKGIDGNNILHTDFAQPAIVSTSIAGIKLLYELGIHPKVAIGHSVGEIAALYHAGILTEEEAITLAEYRGKLMHETAAVKGAMISIRLGAEDLSVKELIQKTGLSPACINSPSQTVLSGSKETVEEAARLCSERNTGFTLLNVENAFHSALMKNIEGPFSEFLSHLKFKRPVKKIFSTVSGKEIVNAGDAAENMIKQLTHPVLFSPVMIKTAEEADIWIETGAGNTLSNLLNSFEETKTISLDLSGKTVAGILRVAGLMFVFENTVRLDRLFENKFFRPLALTDEFKFIGNPCEKAGVLLQEDIFTKTPVTTAQPKSTKPEVVFQNKDTGIFFKEALALKLGLSPDSFNDTDRMLNDLHLNSLFVAQFLTEFAATHQLNTTSTPLEYANATIGEIITMLRSLNDGSSVSLAAGNKKAQEQEETEGIGSWVRAFEMIHKESALHYTERTAGALNGCAAYGNIPEQFTCFFSSSGANAESIVAFVNENDEENTISTLIGFVEFLKELSAVKNILLVQPAPLCNAFAKSMFRELPDINMTIVTIKQEEITQGLLEGEISVAAGFSEVLYKKGKRLMPELKLLSGSKDKNMLPANEDIVLVTGGAKGITVECVRSLGKETDCRFVLLGKSRTDDPVVKENLESLRQTNIRFEYYSCDIADKDDVKLILKSLKEENKTITGIIHAAGTNSPKKITDLTADDITTTLAPKVNGLRNLADGVNMLQVKFVISFGSVIAETGMEGNADYALANEWMRNEMNKLSAIYSATKFLNIEWSVWGGTGMGQNLGVLETLKSRGIQPISLDNGLQVFLHTLKNMPHTTNIVVSARYGKLNTIKHTAGNISGLYRYVEEAKVYYPGIELVSECNLSSYTDFYLNDHVVEGNMLLPAVFGMEAMLQAVAAVAGCEPAGVEIRDACFLQPVIAGTKEKKIRIIVQHQIRETYSAVIRDENTQFKKDHFKATFIIRRSNEIGKKKIFIPSSFDNPVDIYQSLLFHKGSFRRITGYNTITAYGCIAAASTGNSKCFPALLPTKLLLADPFLNDAVLHAVQVCVPDKVLLPVRIKKIVFHTTLSSPEIIIHATETAKQGDEYVYDIDVANRDGQILQQWKSVTFKAIKKGKAKQIPEALLSIALQRRLDKLAGENGKAAVHFNSSAFNGDIIKRTDGRPMLIDGNVSKSATAGRTFFIDSAQEFFCDMEIIQQQPEGAWHSLLGLERFNLAENIRDESGEDLSSTATRVWCAMECGRKAGLQYDDPFVFEKYEQDDDTVYISAGINSVMTYRCVTEGRDASYIFAVLLKKGV